MSDAMAVAKFQLQSKSMLIGLLLTFFFGGVGMFYVSVIGGIICTIIEIILWAVAFLTMGFGVVLMIPFHLLFIICIVVAINSHNKKLIRAIDG